MSFRNTPFPTSVAAILALGIGLVVSGILSVWLSSVSNGEADLVFQKRAVARLTAVEYGLQDAEDGLAAINRLFTTVESVSREQFQVFTQPLLVRYPYVRAFVFQRLVTAAERPAFDAARREIDPGFVVTEIRKGKAVPASTRPLYRIIDYVEPMAGNETVFGVDAASVPYQDEAVREAGATGRPKATGLFQLLQDPGWQRGFSIVMPVYRHGTQPTDADPRRDDIIGYTSAVFRTSDLFQTILSRAGMLDTPDLDISIYAGDETDERHLAFRRKGAPTQTSSFMPTSFLFDRRPASISRTFKAAGGHWHVAVATMPGAIRGSYARGWAALLGGSLISVLVAAYLQMLAMRNAQLAHANTLLTEDVASRKKAELALRRSQAELRELAAHQERVREDERKRIAREIHDDLGQNLLALRLDVSMLDARTATIDQALNRRVRIVLGQIDTTMKSVRAIINNLRPPVLDLGLQAALEWLTAQFRERSRINCTLAIDRTGLDLALTDEQATAIFRIVQESLSNVVRHAQAGRAEIGLRRDGGRLLVTVADNGIGSFPGERRKPRSFGLIGIKERAHVLGGELHVESMPGKGTVVMFSIAIEAPPQPGRAVAGAW